MHYWNALLHDVKNKYHYLENTFSVETHVATYEKITRDLREYYLGDAYPDVYVTKREAESMFWIVQGLTIPQTARELNLSPRTVEFYVRNLKLKLNCDSKKQLIGAILQTNLMQQLEKEGLRIVKH